MKYLGADGEAPTDLLAVDMNQDGLKDILAVYHRLNKANLFLQKAEKDFFQPQDIPEAVTGFHPGGFFDLEKSGALLLAAEGSGQVREVQFNDKPIPPKISQEIRAPNARYIASVNWPFWGDVLAISQFSLDQMLMIRGYKPLHPEEQFEIATVPLSPNPPSVRNAERLTVGDLDGDGIHEILFASPITKEIMVLRFPGKEGFPKAEPLMQSDDWGMPLRVYIEDLDGDGHMDLTLVDSAGFGKIHLLKNDGQGKFSEAGTIDFPLEKFGKAIWQLSYGWDRDGAHIAYVTGAGGQVLFHLDPTDPFHDWKPRVLASSTYDPSFDQILSDLNGDGWLDIVVARTASVNNLMVMFGPLNSAFDEIAAKGVVLSD